MNFLKKKLKPLTSGLGTANQASNLPHARSTNKPNKATHNKDRDLEDDLYDEYVVEAPPHPSELLALGVDPSEIDVNDPDKLRELYNRAKELGQDKGTNSILLAKQRQKEQIEEKKKTREEWKIFDSITARADLVAKQSQKHIEQLQKASAVEQLKEPEYELRLSPDQVFKSTASVKVEKEANEWVDFGDSTDAAAVLVAAAKESEAQPNDEPELDEFGCPKQKRRPSQVVASEKIIVQNLLDDFGIDLRSPEEKARAEREQAAARRAADAAAAAAKATGQSKRQDIDLKAVARPRPRPHSAIEEDPFDTSHLAAAVPNILQQEDLLKVEDNNDDDGVEDVKSEPAKVFDPFDTSYVDI